LFAEINVIHNFIDTWIRDYCPNSQGTY